MDNKKRKELAIMHDTLMTHFRDFCTIVEAYERLDHYGAESILRSLLELLHARYRLLFGELGKCQLADELAKLKHNQ